MISLNIVAHIKVSNGRPIVQILCIIYNILLYFLKYVSVVVLSYLIRVMGSNELDNEDEKKRRAL